MGQLRGSKAKGTGGKLTPGSPLPSSGAAHVQQFKHAVPAVIPRHYHVTFLNCNTHSGRSVGDDSGVH